MIIRKGVVFCFCWQIAFSGLSQLSKGTQFIGGNFNISGSNTDGGSSISNMNNTGASYGYYVSYPDDNQGKSSSYTIIPNYGVFIKNKWAIGISANVSVANSSSDVFYQNIYNYYNSYDQTNASNTITLGLAAFTRYYVMIHPKFGFFFTGSLGMANTRSNYKSKNTQNIGSADEELNSYINLYSFTITPSMVWFISNRWGLEASFGSLNFGYSINNSNSEDELKGYTVNTNSTTKSWNLPSSQSFSTTTIYIGISFYIIPKKEKI